MADNLCAALDEFFTQSRHRSVADRFWRRKCPQEIAEVVGKRIKLELNCIGGEGPTGKLRPFDYAYALLDPLHARAAFVLEGDDIFRRSRHIGDDESDARIKLARTLFDLGGDPTRLPSASGPVLKVGVIPLNMVWRPAERVLSR